MRNDFIPNNELDIVKNQTAFYLMHSIGNMMRVSVSILSARAGTQPSCRVPLWAAGRKDENYDNCYIPYDGDEHAESMPFEVKYSIGVIQKQMCDFSNYCNNSHFVKFEIRIMKI